MKASDGKLDFQQQLLSVINSCKPDTIIVTEALSIQQLATLTKLIVRHQQCLRNIKLDQPIIVVVLQGIKTIYLDEKEYIFQAGDLFFVPRYLALDVINQPDSNSHSYIALVLELADNLISRIRQAYPELINYIPYQPTNKIKLDIPLTPQLQQSLIYLVKNIIDNAIDNNSYLHQHRLIEVILLILQQQGEFIQLINPDLPTHIIYIIAQDLSLSWSTAMVAQKLNVSVSTLKRQLKSHNLNFGEILNQERMKKAMRLLQENKYTVSEVALACGYQSSSRFAARFRNYYQVNPSKV